MPRIDLFVPFEEKDEVKALGARWDQQAKKWYVPDGLDPGPFARWRPAEAPKSSIRAPQVDVLEASRECWKCGSSTPVYAVRLVAGFETREMDDDGADRWERHGQDVLMSFITFLPQCVTDALAKVTPRYHLDISNTVRRPYWMNHCAHCAAKLGDFDTIEEVDSPFSGPVVKKLFSISGPFECDANIVAPVIVLGGTAAGQGEPIWTFDTHPLREQLYSYLPPLSEEYAWHARLDAKAGDEDVLLCFFSDVLESSCKRVIEFLPEHGYAPPHDGQDMTSARVGQVYEIEIQYLDGEYVAVRVEEAHGDW